MQEINALFYFCDYIVAAYPIIVNGFWEKFQVSTFWRLYFLSRIKITIFLVNIHKNGTDPKQSKPVPLLISTFLKAFIQKIRMLPKRYNSNRRVHLPPKHSGLWSPIQQHTAGRVKRRRNLYFRCLALPFIFLLLLCMRCIKTNGAAQLSYLFLLIYLITASDQFPNLCCWHYNT